jgi:hypothetical protein
MMGAGFGASVVAVGVDADGALTCRGVSAAQPRRTLEERRRRATIFMARGYGRAGRPALAS